MPLTELDVKSGSVMFSNTHLVLQRYFWTHDFCDSIYQLKLFCNGIFLMRSLPFVAPSITEEARSLLPFSSIHFRFDDKNLHRYHHTSIASILNS
jgi:hypothetical protein